MRTTRLAAGLVAALALLLPVAGCASVPSSGPVMHRQADAGDDDAIALNPPAPLEDAGPEALVRSFLLAGISGSSTAKQYDTAQLYLTSDERGSWEPTGNVVIYQGSPDFTLATDGPDAVDVTVSVNAVARVDANGTYTEASDAAPFTTDFSLTRNADEQWRIDELEDGILVPERLFANQFTATQLHFPSRDLRSWVPDQRWFPRNSWRARAVAELLDGPPDWLQGAVGAVAPEGTQLAVPTVTDDNEGTVEVRLSDDVGELDESLLGLFFAQLEVTLSDGEVRPEIALYAGDARLTEPVAAEPALPATPGAPIALLGDELYTVSDEQLTYLERPVHLEGLSPTAIALGPSATPVVVRDGRTRIVRVTDVNTPSGLQELLTGKDLADPSVDRYGYVWSADDLSRTDFNFAEDHGRLLVADQSGNTYHQSPDWLRGRQVIGVRVAPDGVRVAVVSRRAGSTSVHVAAVVRGENGEPQQLTSPLRVAASVSGVTSAQWSDQTALLLLARDEDGTSVMYETGVGGLPDDSGSTEAVQQLADVKTLTSGIAGSGALALTVRGDLYQESTTGWGDPIGEDVLAVAYPG